MTGPVVPGQPALTDPASPGPAVAATRPARAGFREAVRAEWTKLRTARSAVVTAAVLAGVFPALATLVAVTGSLQPDDTILGATVLAGATVAQLVAAGLGVLVTAGEHRTGMLATTLAACPRRSVVLAAKAAVVAAVVAAITLPAAAASWGIGVLVLDGDAYAAGAPMPALVGVALALAAAGVLGVAVGTLVPQVGGALGVLTGLWLVPSLVAPLLGDLQRWLAGASLHGVVQKLAQSSDATHDAVGSLGAWPSLAVLLAATLVVTAVAARSLQARDL